MRFDPKRLRNWFALSAVAIVLVVSGFYLYARWRIHHAIQHVAEKLHVDIQQSTEGFTLSKSEGGRTLSSTHPRRPEQFKQGGGAVLQEGNTITYGHQSPRFVRIYAPDSPSNPASGMF